jgi:imidazolonepropionase-like amidohydrolase
MRTSLRLVLGFALLASPLLFAQADKPIVIKAATVLDGKGQILRDTIIVVEGAKIVSVGGTAPSGAITYDLAGLTVSPGWIDTHVHIDHHIMPNGRAWPFGSREETPRQTAIYGVAMVYQTLMAGFTTVQSLGSPDDKDLRDAVERHDIPGARVVTSLGSMSERTGTPDEIRQYVRKTVDQGADLIKIFASKSIREGGAQTMTDEQLRAACGEAKALGKRSVVHAHSAEAAKAATLAGCTSIEHGAFVTDEVFSLMEERGTYYDPNIGLVLQNYLEHKPAFYGSGNYNDEGFAFMEKGIAIVSDTFRKALAHKKLKIVYGTDATAGANGRNYEEFIARVKIGQAPMAAVVSATSVSAESLGMEKRIGTIAPGFDADIVAFDGNPLQDPTAVRRAVFVMKGGKVFENLARGTKAAGARTAPTGGQ